VIRGLRAHAWVILQLIVKPRILRRCGVAALVLIAVVPAACGDGQRSSGDSASAQTRTETAPREPASTQEKTGPLAVNAADAERIVGEGAGALKRRLAALQGHPVVVNQWASWCPPCLAEFPFFTKAAATYGEKVAFVGIDFRDDRANAEAFLRDQSSGFPSVFDPDGKAVRVLRGGRFTPATYFIAPGGERSYTKIGGYTDFAQLDADIRRHALGAR